MLGNIMDPGQPWRRSVPVVGREMLRFTAAQLSGFDACTTESDNWPGLRHSLRQSGNRRHSAPQGLPRADDARRHHAPATACGAEEDRAAGIRLFVAIDDFCRQLDAAILPDKTQHSATKYFSSRGVMNARYD